MESRIRKKYSKQWEEDKIYDFTPKENNFTIDTPPPYPSGRPWHIGAAAHYSQIDMIARTARMAGKNVYFPIGIAEVAAGDGALHTWIDRLLSANKKS